MSWHSVDGTSWSRNEQVIVDAEMRDVVWFASPNIYVAVGHQVSDGAVWTSQDGMSWTRAALLTFPNPGGGIEIESITTHEQGLIAVGQEWYGEGAAIPAIWTSDDARTWMRTEIDMSGVDSTSENGLVDVASSEDDLFAVGYSWRANATHEPNLWASLEGGEWRQLDLVEPDAIDSVLNSIAAGGDGTLVMVGESDAEHVDARAWVSLGGENWTGIEVESGPLGVPDLRAVTRTESGWVAVGSDGTTRHELSETIAAVWEKGDAGGWTRYSPRNTQLLPYELAGFAGMTSVAAHDNVIVAGGVDGSDCEASLQSLGLPDCDLDAAFWIRIMPG